MKHRKAYGPFQQAELNADLASNGPSFGPAVIASLVLSVNSKTHLVACEFNQISFRHATKDAPAQLILQDSRLERCNFADLFFSAVWCNVEMIADQFYSSHLHNAHLWRCRFNQGDLRTLSCTKSCLDGVEFINCDLSYTNWEATYFSRTQFEDVHLAHAVFRGCTFLGVDFTRQSDLDLARFENCRFIDGRLPQILAKDFFEQNLVIHPVTIEQARKDAPEKATAPASPPPPVVAAPPQPSLKNNPSSSPLELTASASRFAELELPEFRSEREK